IKSVAANSIYAGTNMLKNDGTGTSTADTGAQWDIVASYNRTGTTVDVETIKIAVTDIQLLNDNDTGGLVSTVVADDLFAIADATDPLDNDAITIALKKVESVLSNLADAAAKLGAAKSRVDLQKEF